MGEFLVADTTIVASPHAIGHKIEMDRLSPEQRRALMARIRGKDTTPELKVRRTAHALGYRFRLHRRDLPGSPDLVFPSRWKVVFVHGCYWHRHDCPRGRFRPARNQEYWDHKFEKNVERDQKALEALRKGGWQPLVIWECETKNLDTLADRLRGFLG